MSNLPPLLARNRFQYSPVIRHVRTRTGMRLSASSLVCSVTCMTMIAYPATSLFRAQKYTNPAPVRLCFRFHPLHHRLCEIVISTPTRPRQTLYTHLEIPHCGDRTQSRRERQGRIAYGQVWRGADGVVGADLLLSGPYETTRRAAPRVCLRTA